MDRGPGCGRCRLRRLDPRDRDRARVPQPAVDRVAHRLSAEDSAARLHRRRRADRRIRRRAPRDRRHRRRAARDEAGHPRRGGRTFLPAQRDRLPRRGPRGRQEPRQRQFLRRWTQAGRVDDHAADRAQLLPVERTELHPQVLRGAADLQDRGEPDEGSDPRGLHQPDLPRQGRVGLRVRRARLLRESAEGRDAGRGGDARGAPEGAVDRQSGREPEAGPRTPGLRPRSHEAARQPQRRGVRGGQGRAAGDQGGRRIVHGPCPVRRRDGPPGGAGAVPRRRLFARIERLHDVDLGRAERGVRIGPDRRPRLRAASRLQRARGVRGAAKRRRGQRARRHGRGRARRASGQRRHRRGGGRRGLAEVRARAPSRRDHHGQRRRPQVRRSGAVGQGAAGQAHPARRDHPCDEERERCLGDHSDADRAGGVHRVQRAGRRDPGAGGRPSTTTATSSTT